jgi:trimethylamine--corrinoid protein Co-methyltransferase
MSVPEAEAQAVLRKGGAHVDVATDAVRLPPELVEEALQRAPHRFHLCDRRGGRLELPAEGHHHISGCETLQVLDYESGQLRQPTLQDSARFARLADALPLIAGLSPQVANLRGDDSPEDLALQALGVLACNTSKHCLIAPLNRRIAEVWLDLGDILADEQPLADHPVISVCVSSNSPLQWEAETLGALILTARRGVPLFLLPAGQAGMSAPITLAGTLALKTAETLFAVVLAQLARPGVPVLFGGIGVNILDMRTVDLASAGPEWVLGNVAGAQMARYYNLPSYSNAAHADGKSPDQQVGMEKMACMLSALASGIDVSINAGSLNKTTVSSYEQMIIDHEMLRYLYRCLEGVTVNEDTLAFEVIAAAGHGGSYLMADHTRRYLRSGENLYLRLFDRTSINDDVPGVLARAHEEVQAVLTDHKPDVPEELAAEIASFVEGQLHR